MTFSLFKDKYGIKLTHQQERAVQRAEGHTLLLAVPGSGKTSVIVSRIGYMMECLGIPHTSILTLTYSVSSCRDMKERYISLFGSGNVPQFRTINGICSLIIREYEKVLGRSSFELMDNDTHMNDILTDIYSEVYGKHPDIGEVSELASMTGYARNMMMTDREADEYSDDGKLGTVLSMYRKIKKSMRIMDYDDQLEYAYTILRKYPQIRDIFRKRYRYINVDEAQDTSKLQHEIIHLLADGNLFMVGDEDQSIYGFRAAYPSALMDFDKRYPDAEIMFMERNFRSTKNIISGASRLIVNNTERREKHMFTENDNGEDIAILSFPSYHDQFPFLQKLCRDAMNQKEKTAILFRNNESALPLIDMLERSGTAYSLRDNDCLYFSNTGVCDMLMMLSYCEDPDNKEIFLKIATRLGCGLTVTKAREICENADMNGASLYDEFKRYIYADSDKVNAAQTLFYEIEHYHQRTVAQAIRNLHKDTCFGRFLEYRCKDRMKIGVLAMLARQCDGYDGLMERLCEIRNIAASGQEPGIPCISLSTMHSAKGLEYDNVYIIDVKEGTLPGNPTQNSDLHKIKAYIEEERRLFYVAVTRAKKKLTILTYHSEYDGTHTDASRFIRELADKKISIYDISKKKDGTILKKESVQTDDISEFHKDSHIIHKNYGAGVISDTDGEKCTVVFADGTKKIFSLPMCLGTGMIRIKKDQGR